MSELEPSDSSGVEGDLIKIGDYIVIQKQKYFKLHQLNSKCDVTLGKDRVDLTAIVGQKFWTTFKLVAKSKREFSLEVATTVKSLPQSVMKEVSSGSDNRNITDNGKSQLLSTEEIVAFRDSGLSAQNIVSKLIESSTTFKSKTEYSQEKYLKKKEKKYFEYIVILKPTMRLIADIFYSKDQLSVLGLRNDSIAQILSYANVQSHGTYLLYENGTQALLGAAILDNLQGGSLVNMSAGKFPQKQAILGMNFSEEKMRSFLNVKLSDFIGALEGNSEVREEPCVAEQNGGDRLLDGAEMTNGSCEDDQQRALGVSRKRKQDVGEESFAKRPRWLETLEKAIDLVKGTQVDGLIVACKDYPLPVILKLLDYLKPSRSLVVYSVFREPLVQVYSELKKSRKDVIGLHLYENWLRSYQVLTDRTHPDVNMSASGGHILIGTKVTLPE